MAFSDPPPFPGSDPSGQPPRPQPPSGAPPAQPFGYQSQGTEFIPPSGANAGPQAPQPNKGGGAKKVIVILVALFAMFLLMVGGCIALIYSAARGPIDSANEFLAVVQTGNYAEAESLVAPGCSLNAAEIEASLGGLTSYNLTGFSSGTVTEATGTVTLGSAEQPFQAQVAKNADDEWRVCSLSFDVEAFGS